MSSFLYGYATRGRTSSENPFVRPSLSGTEGDQADANRAKQFVEMVAGLVPAEVLAIQLFVFQALSDNEGSSEEAVATVDDVGWLRGSFIALGVLALVFYFGGADRRTVRRPFLLHHASRCLVVVAAFGIWNWLQPVSAWHTWFDLDVGPWLIVGAIAAGAVVAFNLIVVKYLPLPPPPPPEPGRSPPVAS